MRRILAHLNITWFRKYAIELVKFLEKEIYGEEGFYEKYVYRKKKLGQIKKPKTNTPLYNL